MNSILVVFMVAQFSFILGFLLGKSTKSESSLAGFSERTTDSNKSHKSLGKMVALKIDDTRFVTKIQDDGLVKKGNDLGTSSSVEDDIGSSVSKLAQLKKNK